MKKEEKSRVLFVRLPKELDDKIEKFAKSQYRSKASVAKQAIKEFLDRLD